MEVLKEVCDNCRYCYINLSGKLSCGFNPYGVEVDKDDSCYYFEKSNKEVLRWQEKKQLN